MNWNAKYKKTPEAAAVFSALIAGYLTHNFALTNVLHNIDDIGNQPYGYGAGLTSGRWLLTLLGDTDRFLGGNYNLPFINGILFLVLIAFAAGMLTSVFKMKNRISAGILGMLAVVFPSAAVALFYRFTAVYYGIAFLLAVLAAWVTDKHRWGVLLSALCTALSLGIYQAYVSITIGIFVLVLIRQALEGGSTVWTLVCNGLRYGLALMLGLLSYFLCLKVCLAAYGTTLSSYNGMDTMGKLALKDMPELLWKTFYCFATFPLRNYCGLAGSKLVKAAYILLGGISVSLIVYILAAKRKKAGMVLLTGALCLVFPFAVNFVMIMGPNAWIYTMMVYAFALVACVPLILLECLPERTSLKKRGILTKVTASLVLVIVLSYAYIDNVNYTAMYYVDRQVENYISSIVTQVRMTEGFDAEKKWALIGRIEDPLINSPWEYELSYGGAFDTERTLNDVSQYSWFWNYVGYRMPTVSEDEITQLSTTAAVKEMPCWPSQGSIKVIDDTVVIKFQELAK